MDVEAEAGSLTQLPKAGTKGRKKKSAVAKLAEKRRRSQSGDGGSDFGSTVSLQKPEEDQKQAETALDVEADNKINGESYTKTDKTSDKKDPVQPTKRELPKAPPRKLNALKSKETENSSKLPQVADLEGGVVVSIYDKKEASPPGKRKPSPTHQQITTKTDTTDGLSDVKKELFPKDSGTSNAFSLLSQGKAQGGLPPLNDLASQKKPQVGELSPLEPMDIDFESDGDKDLNNDDYISNNAPSDATVHRFRALKMAPDRSRSEESLKNCQFVPKPPSTPRSGRRPSKKGEKRNRENNSSGEEADTEAKKQNSETAESGPSKADIDRKMEVDEKEKKKISPFGVKGSEQTVVPQKQPRGLRLHPDALTNSGFTLNINQNMNKDLTHAEKSLTTSTANVTTTTSTTTTVTPEITASQESAAISQDGKDVKDVKEVHVAKTNEKPDRKKSSADKKKGSKSKFKKGKVVPVPLDGGDEKMDDGRVSPTATIDTIGSASDLRALNDNYKAVLKNGNSEPVVEKSVIPSPKAGAGKLSPITPKSLPPPLPHDMKSSTLRTAYKADPSYTMTKYFGGGSRTSVDNISQRSLPTATAHLHTLSTKEVRESRMKQGSLAAMLLSSSELDRYFPERRVGLWVGCWNMAEIKDCRDPLDDFLLPEISEYVQDIYAIGTQENAMNKKEWEIILQETLGPSHVLFHSITHGALHLAIFVKRDLMWFCTVPEDDLVQTRAVTMVKTKGAVAICFSFFGTSFLFINCHLTPGDGKKKDRADDYDRIVKNLNLPKTGNSSSPGSSNKDVTTRFDCVFWMGDLNFRIEVYKGKQAVEDLVQSIQDQEHPNFEDLVSGDQLTRFIVEGSIFQGFQEGRINFKPTYKFDIGNEDRYDTSSKNRIPSYTDRVLFRAKKKNSITCTHYDSPTTLKCSDHRPVFALFEAAIKPARDSNLQLAAGQFDRLVYAEANKRLSKKVEVVQALQKDKSSTVCVIQ